MFAPGTERTGIKDLAQQLKAEAVKQKLLMQPVPGSWGVLSDFIAKEKEKGRTPYLSWEQFKKIALECSVVEADVQNVAEFLNDVGVRFYPQRNSSVSLISRAQMLIYFSNIKASIRDLVVLDPQV